MDRERLTRLLEEPGRMVREDLDDLKALTEKYPWFSSAQLLRAVGDHAFGDVLEGGSLEEGAAHIPSRFVLFDLKDISLEQAAEQLQAPRKLDGSDTSTNVEAQEVPDGTSEEAEPPTTATLGSASTPIDPEKEELDRQIMESALASAYDLTWQERISSTPTKVPTPKDTVDPILPSSKTGSPQDPVEDPVAAKTIGRNTRLKFSDWLSVPNAEPVPSKGTGTGSSAGPHAHNESPDPPAADPPTVMGMDPKDLIDRFIQSETPPPARKAEFFTPQSAAKKSLDDSAGLVSETLARIYEKQGNFQKAMEAYRKLALKYPEKSAYFAALSKELEGRSNA